MLKLMLLCYLSFIIDNKYNLCNLYHDLYFMKNLKKKEQSSWRSCFEYYDITYGLVNVK